VKSLPWLYWISPPYRGPLNMAWDEICLSQSNQLNTPIFRSYRWQSPATTFGYFQPYHSVRERADTQLLIRRPTGGGIVSHRSDWTYSLSLPPGSDWYRLRARESYCRLHQWIREALHSLGIATDLNQEADRPEPGSCFVGAEENDLVVDGQKCAGAAQKRSRTGLLIQGSLQPPPPTLSRNAWEAAMRSTAASRWAVQWESWRPSPDLETVADNLVKEKYGTSEHNQRR